MRPFEKKDLRVVLAQKYNQVKEKVENYTNEEIMANDIEFLIENLYQEFYVEPVSIMDEDFSKRKVVQKKIIKYIDPFFRGSYDAEYVEVDGIKATFFYPFSGDRELFYCRASVFLLGDYPDIEVKNGYVEIRVEATLQETKQAESGAKILSCAEAQIKEIKKGIEYANENVNTYNNGLKYKIKKLLEERKTKVQSFYDISKILEVPIEKKDYTKKQVEVARRIVPIAHKYQKEDYYNVADEDYEAILETIKHTGSTYERTPDSYKYMHEEDLRNTLLATLNATYKGGATGETFRGKGKTDICIEQENRAAFVAECKMWTGPKTLINAVEQLDSYLTWRDCKTALIYFVRKKDFLAILDKAYDALKTIGNIRSINTMDKNEFACSYVSKSNPGQLIKIRVMLFNMYSEVNT